MLDNFYFPQRENSSCCYKIKQTVSFNYNNYSNFIYFTKTFCYVAETEAL